MVAGIAVSGVTQTITATVTTVGTYSISTTANGVTFAGSGTFAGTGAQNIVLTTSGTPTAAGSNTFTLNTTPNCGFSRTTVVFCASGATTVVEVYQWGRGSDGHQCRTSATTATLSSSDQPGHGEFILAPSAPNDWRNPQNTNLWQGVNGVNNPCPSGYRIPTQAELNAERLSWSTDDAAGAFASPLKLPMSGFRNNSNGSLLNVGIIGLYWSGTVSSTWAHYLDFDSGGAYMSTGRRANGRSVRCLKD
jgi:hypothetical protein